MWMLAYEVTEIAQRAPCRGNNDARSLSLNLERFDLPKERKQFEM
jgi:hypothetical protein